MSAGGLFVDCFFSTETFVPNWRSFVETLVVCHLCGGVSSGSSVILFMQNEVHLNVRGCTIVASSVSIRVSKKPITSHFVVVYIFAKY